MRSVAMLVGSVLCVSTWCLAARASDDDARAEPPQDVWYGWQTLTADGMSAGSFAAGVAIGKAGAGARILGVGGFVFAAPIVHMAHENVGRGFASMGLRILMGGLSAMYVAYGAGAAGAIPLVANVFVDTLIARAPAPTPAQHAVLPVFGVQRDLVLAGLSGTF